MRVAHRFCLVLGLLVLVMVAAPVATTAWAQNYPTRPITMLVGLAPGGITDVMARLYAQKLSVALGQNVIVENRPAGSGAVAAAALQKAEPDGYMLLVFSGAQHATVPAMSDTAIYDPVKGAEPIGVIFNFSGAVAVPADSPAKTIPELVALSKSKPEGLNFGSPGVGTPSHLAAAKLVAATGMKVQFIHYKGGAPMMTDLVAGRLDAAWPSAPASRAFLEAGKIRALAIDGDRRWKLVPEVPTLKEAGFGEVSVANWFAVAAAPGTPQPIIAKLSAAIAEAGRDPDLVRRVEEQGLSVATSSPAELGQWMSKEAVDIRALIDRLNLRQQQ